MRCAREPPSGGSGGGRRTTLAETLALMAAHSGVLSYWSWMDLSAREIVQESMRLAGEICIFTNQEIGIEEL